jgi:hypothetical protein
MSLVLAPERLSQTGRDRRAEVGFSPADCQDRAPQFSGGSVLQQVAICSRSHAFQHVLGIVMHAEDEHSRQS